MLAQLTGIERQRALLILLTLAFCGLALAVMGSNAPLGGHGWLIMVAAIVGIFQVISVFYEPEPSNERLNHYYDDPTKFGIVVAMVWAVFGLFVGDWVA